MESEDYYDSLDEDESNYQTCEDNNEFFDSVLDVPSLISDIVPLKQCDSLSKTVQVEPEPENAVVEVKPVQVDAEGLFLSLATPENDVTIPFYENDLSITEVNKTKNFSNVNKSKRRPWRRKSVIPVEKLKSKSYLNMFQEKMSDKTIKNDKLSLNDSSRATASDLTSRNGVCEDFDNNSIFSKIREYSENDSYYEGSFSKRDFSISISSLDSKFESISQHNVGSVKLTRPRRKCSHPIIMKIPELGGLGPEISMEKLECLKKRQLYGQKVSESNKIKMNEKKLLQNLQEEIERCKNLK